LINAKHIIEFIELFSQITLLANGFTSLELIFLPLEKNLVIKYTCPKQIPMIRNILPTDKYVYLKLLSAVTIKQILVNFQINIVTYH
jgi:hypothetical protein